MTPSLEGWSAKAKEAPLHQVRLVISDYNKTILIYSAVNKIKTTFLNVFFSKCEYPSNTILHTKN